MEKKINKWEVRDEDNRVWIFSEKPVKEKKSGSWIKSKNKGDCMLFDDKNDFFENVKWEDECPSPIEITAL